MEDQQAQHCKNSLLALVSTLLTVLEEADPAIGLGPQPRTPDTVLLSQGFLPTLAFALLPQPHSATSTGKCRHAQPKTFFSLVEHVCFSDDTETALTPAGLTPLFLPHMLTHFTPVNSLQVSTAPSMVTVI